MILIISILLLLLVPPATMALISVEQAHCLNFQSDSKQIENTCAVEIRNLTYQPAPSSARCMTCTIRDVNIVTKSNCVKALSCVALFFGSKSLFENFFARHHNALANAFPNRFVDAARPHMYIFIENYSTTRLTVQDLAKTINVNSSSMAIHVNLTNFIWRNLLPTEIVSHPLPIQVYRFMLYVCGYQGRMNRYTFRYDYKKIKHDKGDLCEVPYSAKEQLCKQL